MKKKALICGIGGQDGAFLAKFLISKNYDVFGSSRDPQNRIFSNLKSLNIYNKIKILCINPENYSSVRNALEICQPDEIYFLSGQSSVALSFERPIETFQSIEIGILNILEVCKNIHKIRIFHASSSECFGNTFNESASEETAFNPCSPYGDAKSKAFYSVKRYREVYGLFACSGILFNHESPFRPANYVTTKIISSAKRIAKGSNEVLNLGRVDIIRDWGWAPDYVEAMWLMLQRREPKDFVIATGQSFSLEDFLFETFNSFRLDWKDFVVQTNEFYRPNDLICSKADPSNAQKDLGWKTEIYMPEIIHKMIKS